MKRFSFVTIIVMAAIMALLPSCSLLDAKIGEAIANKEATGDSSAAQSASAKEPVFASGKDKEPAQEIVEPAEADYPQIETEPDIVFVLPDPREALIPVPPVQPAQAPEPPKPEVTVPPPEPPAPAVVSQPPVETPRLESPPASRTPPPPPPSVVRPSEPIVSLPPPEEPSINIPNIPFEPVSVMPVPQEGDLVYSRTIRASTGQYVEIPFRGGGWVYLGEFGARRGVSYDSRRMEPEGMTFVFRADTVGTYSLKFNMQDFVRNYILNDYVKVIVEEPPMVSGSSWSQQQQRPDRVVASPRWPLATDPQGRLGLDSSAAAQDVPASQPAVAVPNAPTAQPTTATQPAAATPNTPAAAQPAAPATVEDFLKLARDEYNAGRIAGALRYLDQFMARYPAGSDEAFWLYGQSLEANNETTRDIRLALDYYRRLTNEYPQSSRYSEARRRIAYLERFYFNIQ